ncbi:hypothetical protein mRhiFer1_008316 [Rhinolophus ferrumequinum]|uniref:Aminotransferase class I/classII large domain-containing protein n=1 Tax=Rhinolophus ferrumequinum TaxID=59479 RepID=A0A7J7VR42_RHIFE|nr:hypothetical protein mRhiFer1_008316 [Rhinolophus ferrumequinum]
MKHLRTVHQNSIFHCPTQSQAAVAQSFQREQLHFGQPSSYFVQFPQAVQRKRDHMIRSLQSVGLRPVISQGSYFLITDISDFKRRMPDLPGAVDEPYDSRFVKWMIKNKGLVAIPVSVFYSQSHQKHFDHYIRFCFVKVKGRAVEGGTSPNFPRPAGGCEERGRINLSWCRMNPRSRPWIRSCRSGRMNSGPDVTPRALCHLVGPCTLFRVLSLSRF